MPQNQARGAQASQYIIYACPLGLLADQLDRYFAVSRERSGMNTAHQYMPHCTLTGFFHDDPSSVDTYVAALELALSRAGPSRPEHVLAVLEMQLNLEFHGLLLDGPWLKVLIADFACNVHSPTRRDALRTKDWLHLSLAYNFAADQHEVLAALARDLVDPAAPVQWELRFYERHSDGSWICHASWAL